MLHHKVYYGKMMSGWELENGLMFPVLELTLGQRRIGEGLGRGLPKHELQ